MGWGDEYDGWAPYVPVAKRKARGTQAAAKLAKSEGREPQPAKARGRNLATTFWGLQWCENLVRYSDYANRLPRGATYARNGSIVDLVIEPGRIRALVAGSEVYTIRIDIQTLAQPAWRSILDGCSQEIDSLLDLLAGRLSDGVMRRLTHADDGLFPKPKEISMRCSCPDAAGVCKHLAAVFYGVAARLDQQPELLFKLRKVDHTELIRRATKSENLDRALRDEGASTMGTDELESIFGIELDGGSAAAITTPGKSSAAKKPAGAKAVKKPAARSAQTSALNANKPEAGAKKKARPKQKRSKQSKVNRAAAQEGGKPRSLRKGATK